MRRQMFIDGNKRAAMLFANKIMIDSGCGIITIVQENQPTFYEKLIKFYETGDNDDFIKLCQYLEQEHIDVIKEQRSPKGNCLNNLDKFTTVFIQYIDDKAVGCLAMKDCIDNTVEIGRLYVLLEYRKNKIATKLFQKVEGCAKELGANRIILDTYKRFTLAVALYKKIGFYEIDNYLEYSPYSICMEKKI